MQLPRRDLRPVWYSNFKEKRPIYDDRGFDTGENDVVYTAPQYVLAIVSPAKGEVEERHFGDNIDYDKEVMLVGTPPFDEHSILWVDNLEDGEVPGIGTQDISAHDYVVTIVAEGHHVSRIGIKKVDVSYAEFARTRYRLIDSDHMLIYDSTGAAVYAPG